MKRIYAKPLCEVVKIQNEMVLTGLSLASGDTDPNLPTGAPKFDPFWLDDDEWDD